MPINFDFRVMARIIRPKSVICLFIEIHLFLALHILRLGSVDNYKK